MSLSQRRLTYGMAFPLLNIGILQSMKDIRKSIFYRFKIPKRLSGMLSERTQVLTAGKVPLKYIYRACVSIQMCTTPKT